MAGSLAARNDSFGTAFGDGSMTVSRITSPVGCDAGDVLLRQDLAEQLGSTGASLMSLLVNSTSRISRVILVDLEVDLAPGAPSGGVLLDYL